MFVSKFSLNLFCTILLNGVVYSGASNKLILKAFSSENLKDVELQSFEIPISLIIKAKRKAKTKSENVEAPVTIVIPIHVPNEDNEVTSELLTTTEINNPEIIEEIPPESVEEVPPNAVEATTIPPQPAQQNITGQTIRFPCQCLAGQCGCCTGILLEQRLKMKACGNISFVPEEFVFDMRFSVNNNTVVRRRVSASDPPPVCFNPRRAPFVEVCAELSNIHIKHRTAHACLDIDANVGGISVYSSSFRCFSLGPQGVKTGLNPKPIKKPSGAPPATNLFGGGGDEDDYDDDDDDDDDEDGGLFGGDDDDDGGFFGGGDDDDEGGGLFGGSSDDDDGPFGDAAEGIGDLLDY